MLVPVANVACFLVCALAVGVLYGMLEEDGERILDALFRRR